MFEFIDFPFTPFIAQYAGLILIWGWLLVVWMVLWITWETYRLLKQIDYVSAIQWTYLQITVPEENPYTPKSMENAFDVWSGIHKSPDLAEHFFEGYIDAWYSCEIHCEPNRARYIIVLPTNHRKFFEGVAYGQYPNAEIKEVEDYTQRYNYTELEEKFDMFGTELTLAQDDIMPIRSYREYEDTLAEDDTFIDPHQALLEAFTNIREGEEFWVQILIRPVENKEVASWAKKGEEAILKIAGRGKEKTPGIVTQLWGLAKQLPSELLHAATKGPLEPAGTEKEKQQRLVFTPIEDARMKGILQKISRPAYRTKIRVLYVSPAGKYHKPNQSVAIGAFKQFGLQHLNSLKPDNETKTSGPTYFFKLARRKLRKRRFLLMYQWRDLWAGAGFMMTSEELATLYHLPVKYVKAPVVERATSGLGSAPENIPFV